MTLFPVPAFRDNYIWVLSDDAGHCLVVDPGDAGPVRDYLSAAGLTPCAILVTHHHPDHTGGVAALADQFNIPVFGPARETIPAITHPVEDGDRITIPLMNMRFTVFAVPGHTLGHIAFCSEALEPPVLFCGDTLFSAGCGRLFEGTPEQMDASLQRLAALPDATRVCCTHEYTEANLAFALTVLPGDPALTARAQQVGTLRAANKPSLPVDLGTEKRSNPFLRVDEPALQAALEKETGTPLPGHVQRFAALRAWKDRF